MHRTTLILVLILTFTLTAPTVLAQEDDAESELERETDTREVSVEVDGESVEIESKTKNRTTADENAFEVEFEAEDEVEIKLTFKRGRQVNGSEQETELSYAVETEQLIEFNDTNGNGVWDDGEAVSRYSLEDADFEPVAYTTRRTENGVTEHVITASTSDGRFTITLHAVGAFAEIGSTQVNPTEVKIDLAMDGYEYAEEGTDLALLAKLKTEREIEREEDGEEIEREEGVSVTAGDVQGIFTWKPTAQVDGRTAQVAADIRPRSEAGEHSIVLGYPRGTRIVHDPKVGFRFLDGASTPSIYIVAIIALLVVVAGSFWLRRTAT